MQQRLLLCTALLAAFPAAAQTPAPTAGTDSGEIVVTARRIAERLQDVPLTIKALTGRDLEERGIASLSDLSLQTPGLSYSPDFGRVSERPVIRGISALRPEAPQPVSVFVDGVFVRDGALGLAIDDAVRVEIIKGPQSALYGRSTYAGAINYITVKPGQEFKGKVALTVGSDEERTLFGAVTVPLLKDVLSMRVRARHYEFGGQYINSQTGNKLGDEKSTSGSVQFLLTPSPNFDASLLLDTASDRDGIFPATVRPVPIQAGGVITNQNGSTNVANGGTCNGRLVTIVGNNAQGVPDANVAPSATNRLNGWPCGSSAFTGTTLRRNELDLASYTDPLTGRNYGNIEGLDRDIRRAALTMNLSTDSGYTFTSQSALTKQQSNVGADQSYNGTPFAPATVGGTSWLSYNRDQLEYLSQELRVSSPLDKAFTWLGGGFLYREVGEGFTGNGVIARNAAGAVVTAPRGLTATTGSKVENAGLFGRVQYEFSKALRASFEFRHSEETVYAIGTPLGVATVTSGTCVAGQQCSLSGSRKFIANDPRVTLDYKITPDLMVYVQGATGSKSGGFNLTAGLPAATFTFEGERVKAIEVGAKHRLLNGALLFNVALFRNDIDDLQLSNIATVISPFTGQSTTTTIVNNVGKARTQGVELDIIARPTAWLNLSANYAYTDAKAVRGTELTNGTVFGGNISVAGFTLPRSPKHSAAVSASVEHAVGGSGLRAFGRVDVMYQSRRYAEIQNMIWADPFTRINASGGVRGKNWRATLWVKNAADDDTSLNGFRYFDPGVFRRSAVDFLPRLRQYGVTLAYDF